MGYQQGFLIGQNRLWWLCFLQFNLMKTKMEMATTSKMTLHFIP